MKIITSENLESTGYRCLFEGVKKEGIEPFFNFAQDVKSFPSREVLIRQTIVEQENSSIQLAKNNKDVIKYLQEHEKELTALSFEDENVYNTLALLLKNVSLVNLYLDNASRLEKLKVEKIEFVDSLNSLPKKAYRYYYKIIPLYNDPIYVSKYYTDGKVTPMISEEEAHKYNSNTMPYCQIPFSITKESEPSFVIETEKSGSSDQHRRIEIMNFGFKGSELPTLEELDSNDIPKALIKSNNEES